MGLAVSLELVPIECHKCHAVYGLTSGFETQKRSLGGSWLCPYCGQPSTYGKTALQLAEEKIVAMRAQHDQTFAKLQDTQRALFAEQQAAKKVQRRTAHGVCPCCHRTVKQLAQHMACKHPEFVAEAGKPDPLPKTRKRAAKK